MKKDLMLSIIQKRWIMLCLFVMMCVFGYYSWTQLSIEAYPDIADVTSQVVTQVPGLAAEEVEQQITIPLERAINGLPGMHVMRSKSTFGLSMITIVFKDGTEDYWSRQRVQERLNEVELPYGAVPGLDPLTSPVGEVYRYIIESDQHSLRELTDLQNWVVIPRIKEVSGVADVTNFGGITTQFQVEIDPYKLEQYHLSLSQVIEAIENNNASVGGSILNRGDLGYVVRGIGLIENLDDLGHIVVTTTSGVPVFLNDIGSLKYGNLERKGVLGYTDRTRDYSESLEGIVLLLKHENPSKVLDGIHAAVDEGGAYTYFSGSYQPGEHNFGYCFPYALNGDGIGCYCAYSVLGQLAWSITGFNHHSGILAYRFYPDASYGYPCQSSVTRSHRFWNHCRWCHCYAGHYSQET